MSDNYSIDDILAEIDSKRSGGSHSTESVTEIINSSELRDSSATSHTRIAPEESPVPEEEEARERAESIRRAAEASSRKKAEHFKTERSHAEKPIQFSKPEEPAEPAEPEHSGFTAELFLA